ncbi:MAG: TRAP transporter substrate-binding protein DctP [Deltaproteobacteria bacterium]|nr:TRAP transporter substrate-binding protein DctP [Deltaproteobacteria bacterium]
MKTKLSVLVVMVSFFLCQSLAWSAPIEVKFANLAPEGSAWANVMTEMDKELQSASGGRIKFKFYWGGVMGDEPDMLRKLKIGQIHAAGLTGFGLGQVVSSVRVLELPMIFANTTELDQAKQKLLPLFKTEFQKKGFEFLAYADVGPVNVFANKPIHSIADMRGAKFWVWEGDPLALAAFKAFGISPIPLAIPDVMTSLQTKMIDGVYGPPLGIVALQWHTKVKYMMGQRFNYAVGAFIIDKKFFDSLPSDLRRIFSQVTEKYCVKLVQRTREDNEKALQSLKGVGIETVSIGVKEKAEILAASSKIWPELAGKLFSEELLNQVKSIGTEWKGSSAPVSQSQ